MESHYDIIIVGAGIVGSSLAVMLANHSLRIALIESHPDFSYKKNEIERSIVLSHSSKVILQTAGIWEKLKLNAQTIDTIHVSDQGHFGTALIAAKEEKVPALGYVLSAKQIGLGLQELLRQFSTIDIIQPAKFHSFIYSNQTAIVELEYESKIIKLQSKLLVAADGPQSSIRQYKKIETKTVDYQQTTILCNILLKRSHKQIAYERFTKEGPLAILPLRDNQCGVVWTVNKENIAKMLALNDKEFLIKLQDQFGYRLGKFLEATPRIAAPLKLVIAEQQISPGLVLIGNAVHTLHPVAGQGLNLALRDIAVLFEEIMLAMNAGQPLGDLRVLQQYLKNRLPDQQKIISLTHSLVGIFSNSLLPIVITRDLGLILIDRLSWLKQKLTKTTLGMAGRVPRLACGLGTVI